MLTKLASTQRLESVSKLYENHIQEFLEKLKVSSTTLGYVEAETHNDIVRLDTLLFLRTLFDLWSNVLSS